MENYENETENISQKKFLSFQLNLKPLLLSIVCLRFGCLLFGVDCFKDCVLIHFSNQFFEREKSICQRVRDWQATTGGICWAFG